MSEAFSFRPAKREAVGLILGVAGPSGSGKTFSAMRLASGICADKPFAIIDTEAGRAKHYADRFKFDHGDLAPPFRPDRYVEAITAADKAGYPVIVVDSVSHVWAGDGGILDWQEEEIERMAGDDWKKRESCRMAAWIKPKMAHKQMVQRLLQVRAHLILCFRAEEKIEMIRGEDGKMKIVPKQTLSGLNGWVPVSEKSLPYELTASFLLLPDHPGIPRPIKLQEQHRSMFPLDKPIDEAAGQRVADWARGSSSQSAIQEKPVAAGVAASSPPTGDSWWDLTAQPDPARMIQADDATMLHQWCKRLDIRAEDLRRFLVGKAGGRSTYPSVGAITRKEAARLGELLTKVSTGDLEFGCVNGVWDFRAPALPPDEGARA